jgi:hypothetical protein
MNPTAASDAIRGTAKTRFGIDFAALHRKCNFGFRKSLGYAEFMWLKAKFMPWSRGCAHYEFLFIFRKGFRRAIE